MEEFKSDLKTLVEQALAEGVNEKDIALALREKADKLDDDRETEQDEPGE